MIQPGLVSLEEVFLPYAQEREGRTVYERGAFVKSRLMKTQYEINKLIKEWLDDPHWDLADTPALCTAN